MLSINQELRHDHPHINTENSWCAPGTFSDCFYIVVEVNIDSVVLREKFYGHHMNNDSFGIPFKVDKDLLIRSLKSPNVLVEKNLWFLPSFVWCYPDIQGISYE